MKLKGYIFWQTKRKHFMNEAAVILWCFVIQVEYHQLNEEPLHVCQAVQTKVRVRSTNKKHVCQLSLFMVNQSIFKSFPIPPHLYILGHMAPICPLSPMNPLCLRVGQSSAKPVLFTFMSTLFLVLKFHSPHHNFMDQFYPIFCLGLSQLSSPL